MTSVRSPSTTRQAELTEAKDERKNGANIGAPKAAIPPAYIELVRHDSYSSGVALCVCAQLPISVSPKKVGATTDAGSIGTSDVGYIAAKILDSAPQRC
mmetsp:Transcript_26481/g.71860  ORF Transcript_26481/g.71860 Transcript_26481/m.71860 type:complete len:99 (-) Transcript_26481:304-600(-)